MRIHRLFLSLAAAVHLVLAGWAIGYPEVFLQVLEPPGSTDPGTWRAVGLVLGILGVLYGRSAQRVERGDRIVGFGLAGAFLGPALWVHAVWTDAVSPRTVPLVLLVHLIWWCPFLAYLLRGRPQRRMLLALFCLGANGVACLGLVAVIGGTEAEPDLARRLAFIAGNVPLWATVWLLWTMASMSLLLFFCQWSARLIDEGVGNGWACIGPVLVGVGVAFDLTGEWIEIARMTAPGLTLEEYERLAWIYNLIGPAAANGFYCLAGIFQSAISWRVGFLRGRVGQLGFVMWSVGLGLTGAALLGAERIMGAAGAGVMGLFLLWLLGVAWRLRCEES